jgi:glycosyltransferase 2 family protein
MINDKPKNRGNYQAWLPGVVISLVAAVIVIKLANWKDLPMALAAVRPLPIAICILIQLIAVGTRAAAWRILLNNKPAYWKTFFIVSIGYLLNNLFPLRAGEIGRSVLMGKATGTGTFHVLSSLVLERIFDMAIAAGMLLVTLPFVLKVDWARPMGIITLFLVLAGFLFLFLLARFSEQVKNWIVTKSPRWNFLQKWVVPQFLSLIDGLEAMKSPKKLLWAAFWIGICWILYLLSNAVMLLPLVPGFQL